ncbi:dihydropteroate synthase [Dysgonomonas sp. PFB1-18]|uniref:dihydropteroate synthase n=1 Tax=unclassified Dysgonomonas TaxID=2630389 RepID=UPI0024752960|nr:MULTISPECIES: dihydropteroate synthase [unclassified Dysgonomonas]MDH6307142.1 dihydropteroate synthase [Dysgonomonas sp. PF1-14]MDH6337061.1 dihydropteroate synthase [Dysgonomonas sp. PF1-16]MDH6381047.1 dihydropteroate synthase [Dysgonomonas sp. PFB1-18]MDH6396374.1 dihydropteroate synthase [Dysgonomonas sp. PF1-23]
MNKTINIKGELLDLSSPVVMGILNVTPDSFYSGSRKESEAEIVERAREILDQGGQIIDIGAQSTRPSSTLLSAKEEIERLSFALPLITHELPDAILSIDTFYGDVARFCVEEHGVAIINDISGGEMDKTMFPVAAQLNVPYVLMHMRGTPQTMNDLTDYDDLIQDIFLYFSRKIVELHELGLNDIIIDPGFGFSKTIDQNYELMAALRGFSIFEMPLLVGISRKRMIANLLDTTPAESLNGTTILNTFALENGANILRVHDVKEAVEAVKIMKKLKEYKF